jgi:hypothetical protein
MKIKDEEINLKITPKAIQKVEEIHKDFDVLKLIREAEQNEPKASDYYKLIYAGYIGATGKDIKYEDFLDLIEDYDIYQISHIGVDLLLGRKN